LKQGVVNPLNDALDDWVIGSKQFLKRMVKLSGATSLEKQARLFRSSRAFSIDEIKSDPRLPAVVFDRPAARLFGHVVGTFIFENPA
jgi:hypothetical protein